MRKIFELFTDNSKKLLFLNNWFFFVRKSSQIGKLTLSIALLFYLQ